VSRAPRTGRMRAAGPPGEGVRYAAAAECGTIGAGAEDDSQRWRMRRTVRVLAGGAAGRPPHALAGLLAVELGRRGGGGPLPVVEAADAAARRGAAAIVYVPDRTYPDLAEAAALAAAPGGAARPAVVVAVGSTEVYEPSHRQPGLVDEDFPRPRPPEHPVARRWWQLEEVLRTRCVDAGVPLVVLRAAPVPVPAGGDWVSELLGGGWAPTLPGCDPPLQLLALPDLAAAVALAAEAAAEGALAAGEVLNVVPAQPVPLAWALRLAGVRRLPRPSFGASEPWRGRRRYLRHPWTASGARAESRLGFTPRHSSAETAAALAAGTAWSPHAGWWAEQAPRADLSFDEHGLSPEYIAAFGRTLFRFLHDAWWRVEHRGVEEVPRQGAAVLVGLHRGFMPWDGVMALHLMRREVGRIPRFLVHPSLVKFPFMADYIRRLGGVLACRENADLVLRRQGVLAIFPEGIRGAFTPYRRAYRMGTFGRRDYVRFAVAHGAPIVPFVTVGSAEIFPILGRLEWRWVKRLLGWPYLPLAPPFPLLPVPLPSKWHTWFLEPVRVAGRFPPAAADDPAVVAEIGDAVEARMQQAIDRMLARRRSIWRGSVFAGATPGEEELVL
jgi:1-acyl-sn-glycerol-3-phosphate acyltransferase/nucleoside-diphosphate-sugar epimerase